MNKFIIIICESDYQRSSPMELGYFHTYENMLKLITSDSAYASDSPIELVFAGARSMQLQHIIVSFAYLAHSVPFLHGLKVAGTSEGFKFLKKLWDIWRIGDLIPSPTVQTILNKKYQAQNSHFQLSYPTHFTYDLFHS